MDYTACQLEIGRLVSQTAHERISLDTALSRVSATSLVAELPQPEFRQSLRDGFVLAEHENNMAADSFFPVAGMIQAGNQNRLKMTPGQACRIMTGAMIPEGGVRVIAQEDCTETESVIRISPQILNRKNTYIQEQGSEIECGETVTEAGTVLCPEKIGLLAGVGCKEIEVFRRPRVGFLCTGSELVDSRQELHPGLKISSNRHLLDSLIRQCGAEPFYLGTVSDSPSALADIFVRLKTDAYQAVISTGGMGPGKYDLIEQAFLEAGGKVIYNSLDLRPGKASLCGIIDNTLFFGLPGPPTAVRALVNAIVGPALMQMQGMKTTHPQTIQAHLLHPLIIKRQGVMQLRGGIISFLNGRCTVRMAERLEPSSCYMVIAAEKSGYTAGELINVQLTTTPFSIISI